MLAAATTDTDPADGLVDAVACWTAMFGAGPGAEAGFRVAVYQSHPYGAALLT